MSWKKEFYPNAAQADRWCAFLLSAAEAVSAEGTLLDEMPVKEPFGSCPNTPVNRYVRFTSPDRRPFCGCWQPALKSPAPLLINLPGYGVT